MSLSIEGGKSQGRGDGNRPVQVLRKSLQFSASGVEPLPQVSHKICFELHLAQYSILALLACLIPHLLPLPLKPPKESANMHRLASPNSSSTLSSADMSIG
jgi:hypothetical protein